jgi:hypothetical protein
MFGPLAKLFVEIGAITRPLDIALAGMQARLSGLASTRMMISPMGFGLALRGVDAMFDGLQHVLKAGSELNEATNKMGVVFGDQAGVVGAAADMMADKYGVVKKQYIDMASEYGNLLQGMGGQTRQEAAMMSNVLSKVAADATSVFDTKDFAEAGAKIASGLRGMSLPMSKYGADTQRTIGQQILPAFEEMMALVNEVLIDADHARQGGGADEPHAAGHGIRER